MGLTGVEAAGLNMVARARELADRLRVPLRDARDRDESGVRLVIGAEGLALAFENGALGKPHTVTFALPRPLPRADILRRALGSGDHVIDATAGFGGDMIRIASLGRRVTAIERSPVVFALLEDAVSRGRADEGRMCELLAKVDLVLGDASEILRPESADVVYLDAMFTKPKQTGKSPKEMQLLQDLLGPSDPSDEERLFAAARSAARARVVVKRALKSKSAGPSPSFVLKGQSIRFDVYLRAAR